LRKKGPRTPPERANSQDIELGILREESIQLKSELCFMIDELVDAKQLSLWPLYRVGLHLKRYKHTYE